MAPPRPQPRLDRDTRPFWTGGAEDKLMIHHCPDCGTWIHPPKPVCRNCLSDKVGPEAVPEQIGEGDLAVVPFHAGETLTWRFVG